MTSQRMCKACLLIEGLNTGNTDMGIRKTKKSKVILESEKSQKSGCGSSGGGCSCAGEEETENEETRKRLKDLQF